MCAMLLTYWLMILLISNNVSTDNNDVLFCTVQGGVIRRSVDTACWTFTSSTFCGTRQKRSSILAEWGWFAFVAIGRGMVDLGRVTAEFEEDFTNEVYRSFFTGTRSMLKDSVYCPRIKLSW